MRRAREIWVAIVEEFEKSGLSQDAYAAQRNISVGTLRSWIYRLRREHADHEYADDTSLLPVRVVASAAPQARWGENSSTSVEVDLGDAVRLRFPAGTSASAIAELVLLLRDRC